MPHYSENTAQILRAIYFRKQKHLRILGYIIVPFLDSFGGNWRPIEVKMRICVSQGKPCFGGVVFFLQI